MVTGKASYLRIVNILNTNFTISRLGKYNMLITFNS